MSQIWNIITDTYPLKKRKEKKKNLYFVFSITL